MPDGAIEHVRFVREQLVVEQIDLAGLQQDRGYVSDNTDSLQKAPKTGNFSHLARQAASSTVGHPPEDPGKLPFGTVTVKVLSLPVHAVTQTLHPSGHILSSSGRS